MPDYTPKNFVEEIDIGPGLILKNFPEEKNIGLGFIPKK